MFVSATKNPMRAIYMLLRAPDGEKGLILIDLKAADENGNVEKAHSLKPQTAFRYTSAGEYLIFGGVSPRVSLIITTNLANNHKAIVSYVEFSRLLTKMPTTPNDKDPFKFAVLQAHQTLSRARRELMKYILPMTYSLGKAVGELVGILGVTPKHFESGTVRNSCLRRYTLLILECE